MRQNKSRLGKKLSGSGINSNGLPVVQLHLKPPPPTPKPKKRKEQKRMRYGDRGDRDTDQTFKKVFKSETRYD